MSPLDEKSTNETIEAKLCKKWKQLIHANKITLQNSFFDMGGDSLSAIMLASFIEKEFGLQVSSNIIFKYPTIHQQADYIKSELRLYDNNLNIIKFNDSGLKTPLILIHPIGGTVFCYQPLVNRLKKDRPIIAIQDVLVTGDYRIYHNVYELASKYNRELLKICNNQSFILGGYSAGGTIAFEMARQLSQEGYNIKHLFIYDGWANMPFDATFKKSFEDVIKRQAEKIKYYLFQAFRSNPSHWFEILWNRMEILIKYVPNYLDIEATLFCPSKILDEYKENKYPDDNAWTSYVKGLKVYQSPGNHENLLTEQNIKKIATVTDDILEHLQ